MMDLRRDQEDIYRENLGEARSQIEEIDIQIEEQIESIKARLHELQTSKKTILEVCRSLSKILGEDFVEEDAPSILTAAKKV
jgi:hypothetical protein